MRISDWSSDVCSSDLFNRPFMPALMGGLIGMGIGGLLFGGGLFGEGGLGAMGFGGMIGLLLQLALVFFIVRFALARKSVVEGTSVSVRVALGDSRIIKKKTINSI